MRINVNLAEDLVKEADARAKELYLSRSAYITLCIRQKMDADKLLDSLPELKLSMSQLSQNITEFNKNVKG